MNDREILIKLHRLYTKDEYVAHLEKEISSLKFEIGVLNSELAECRFKKKQLKTDVHTLTKGLRTKIKNIKNEQKDTTD